MKKFLVVLLIAVLTVSSAFAALTGTVTTTAEYDLDAKTFDISTEGEIKGSYKLPFAAFFAGASDEGKTANEGAFPYAVAEATLTVKASKAGGAEWDFAGTAASGHTAAVPAVTVDYADSWKETKTLSLGQTDLFADVTAELVLTKAEIIGEEWKLDFLTGPSVANYSSKIMDSELNAKFTTECPTCEEVIGNKFDAIAEKLSEKKEGITFTWNKYGSVAVAAKATDAEATSYYLISLESVDYALTDELKGQASVAFDKYNDKKLVTYMSGKLAYANLVPGKLTANFAIDSFVAKKDGGIELNGDFAYDNNFITGEAYYASDAKYYTPDTEKAAHPYLETATAFAKNFTYFKATVNGTTKYPAFVPVFTAEGYSTETQKMVADWDLTSTYTKDAKAYFTANIGMTDTFKNLEPQDVTTGKQTLYGSVATTVTNYKTLEDIGKLTFKLGAKNFLDIDDKSILATAFYKEASGAVKTAKESGFYFNATAEDFVVKGLGFIFSAADLINEKGQVFALDVAYADEKENVKATAGFATGLENSIFEGDSTFAYGDVNYKFNEELSGYVGTFARLGGDSSFEHYYVGASYVKKYADEKTNSITARLDIAHDDAARKLDKVANVGLYAKAESTKIVNGATLALQYGKLDSTTAFVSTKDNLSNAEAKGAITATCSIKF